MKTTIPPDFMAYIASHRTSPFGGEEEAHQALTLRAFLVGVFLSLFLSIGAPYGNMILRGSYMCLDFSTPGAIFLFFILVGLLNVIFKVVSRSLGFAIGALMAVGLPYLYLYWPFTALDLYSPGLIFSSFLVIAFFINVLLTARGSSLALNRSELIVVYIMLLIVAALCTMGLGEQLVPMIAALFYYATPENKWAATLFPHAPQRILVNDGANNKTFFEGLTPGQPVPYGAWVEPMLYWGLFLLALYVTMVSLAVIFRRQWMERERLAYPIAQVPLAMIRGEQEDTLVNRFFKNPAMWIGFLLPMVVGSLLALHRYYPSVFTIPLSWNFKIMRQTQTVHLYISFAMLGFSYLINSDIAAGLWVFHLLSKIQKGAFVMAGITSDQSLTYGVSDFPYLAYQGLGALSVMVGIGLWVGREHLKNVFLKALGRGEGIDDSDEILSYRSAALGALGGMGVMVFWLHVMGVPLWVSVTFVIVVMLIFTAMTRIVAEAGIAAVRPPMIAPNVMISGLGSRLLGPVGVMNLSIAYIWAADIRVFLMANCTNGLKLIEGMDRRSRRYVFWAILIAIVIGVAGSSWVILQLAYKHGGINLNSWFFKGNAVAAFSNAQRNMEPMGVYKPGLLFMGIGGLVMGLFMWLRQRFLWWPVHPIGFIVGGNSMMDYVWFNVFLAWLIKTVILKYGGAGLYRRSQVFFFGLIAGQAFVNGMWLIIDYFTGKIGNALFWI